MRVNSLYLTFRQTFVHILRSWHRLSKTFCDEFLVLSSLPLLLIVYDLCRYNFHTILVEHIKNDNVRTEGEWWRDKRKLFCYHNSGSSNSSRSSPQNNETLYKINYKQCERRKWQQNEEWVLLYGVYFRFLCAALSLIN